MRILLLTLLLPFFSYVSYGQGDQKIIKVPVDQSGTTEVGIVHLPDDYSTTSTSYPLLVFLNGSGESTSNPASVYNSSTAGGPAYFISQGQFPSSFVNPKDGKSYKFIVVSAQADNDWSTSAPQLEYILTYLIKTYRVDISRLYLTGLSAGGEGILEYVGKLQGTGVTVNATHKIAAFMPMSTVMNAGYRTLYANTIVADKVGIWGFGSPSDTHGQNTLDLVDWYVNILKPGYGTSTSYSGGHCCWNQFYNPTFRQNGMSMYEWCLQYTQGVSSPGAIPVNPPAAPVILPAVVSLTLPSSTVSLTGTATPNAGTTITKYTWTQQSGPSTATIDAPASATTSVTGMITGIYTFLLTITDSNGKTSSSTVLVTVIDAPVVTVPVANAGTAQSIQLPTSQATLSGVTSTVTNGFIANYAWSQSSGPNTAIITSRTSASTTLTGLVAGAYVFSLTITDNTGKTSTATVRVTVSVAAVIVPPVAPASPSKSSCGGKKTLLTIPANEGGDWITPALLPIRPGDTLVISSKYRWAYLSGDGLHGTASCPITIMNDTGQVEMTSGIAFSNSTYLHITGTGSPKNFYGFYIHSYPTIDGYARGVGIQISDRSSHVEIDHIDQYLKTYAMWIKEEAECADSLKYPNWRLDNMSIHDIRAKNINQDAFYIGSTSPGGERAITCNGVTTSPIPMRVSNIHIYNILLDSVGRTGIQISGGDSGVNEINNCRVTRTGFELNPTQGSGIILGGYTTGYVHDNYVHNTYQHGISLLGAGLMRVENNDIDSSGYLAGQVNPDYSSIAADTRVTTNQGATPPIYSTVYVRNNKVGVTTNRTGTVSAYRSIDIGYGYANLPTWNNDNIICGNVLQNGTTPAEFRINANIGYTSNCGTIVTGQPIPGKIEGESYSAMSGVQTQATSDAGGGLNVDYINQGDWMDYSVNVASAGTYTVGFRVACATAGASFQLRNSSGTILAIVTPAVTGGYQTWATTNAIVTLPAGPQTLRLYASGSVLWNINWMQFTAGSYQSIPGKIEAESYSAMYGVQTQATSDAGGGLNVGWIDQGDWMDYSVNAVSAGTYTVSFRVACANSGATFQLRNSAGTVLATITPAATGGYQTWATTSAVVTLPAGAQTLRLYAFGTVLWNINWIGFSLGTVQVIPGKIEAENYTSMFGVGTESTMDAGGGQDVGWIDQNDYMNYNLSVLTAGTYNMSLRLATPAAGTVIQLRAADGTVLGTLNPGVTGGWQTWNTFSTTVNLPAGNQTLQLYSYGWAPFNINWMKFDIGTLVSESSPSVISTSSQRFAADSTATPSSTPSYTIFPNPVRNEYTVQVTNNYTGSMRIQVINVSGVIIHQYEYNKSQPASLINLSAGDLPAGTYFIRVQVGGYNDIRKMFKL